MFKAITSAISSIFRTIEKAALTVEHVVDLADNETNIIHERQTIRHDAIKQELEVKRQLFKQALAES